MSAYWWGFVTPFLIALALYVLFWAYVIVLVVGKALGFKVEWKGRGRLSQPSEYTLRNNIWNERVRGPIFYGHWYFERSGRHHVNRWIAVGRNTGPCVMFFKLRTLPTPTEEADRG